MTIQERVLCETIRGVLESYEISITNCIRIPYFLFHVARKNYGKISVHYAVYNDIHKSL